MTKKQKQLVDDMLDWYRIYGRNLPWRKTRDPYKILVSEVMLQQTQVPRVVKKYREFLRTFPNAKRLANAKTGGVIKAWRGLGYNRRALYLQQTAQAVRVQYSGHFPCTLKTLKTLPGIGEYTARAILSFAFGESTPVLDTNHRKFYQKTFFGDDIQSDSELLQKAEEVIHWIVQEYGDTRVYDWNQAVMDWVSAHQEDFRLPTPQKRKRTIPFKKTDRYIRGRIVDALREERKVNITALRRQFPDIQNDRFFRIVRKLENDRLILQEKRSIVFP
ncbi:MAG: Fe-S cluster assembly protein HesB [Candidatus Magasanikbacteria bacterium CG11_big_fil_rev_8_21_14_0_20_43_7]|uniref:Adenine DNA glycosylase n=1 Tax=Candidatus Magasanikbacteria bacterium CG11_big_fil_rev_8_21_14_0_20_43_7 TaxID=1974654 RepID=A0A2H0N2K7_9BACT|nr:MAG: Fe-S cluster assembly protein HesB [Candidatus Magasanikbacteria bacterium CG11_big_fil_rev_8_21_14_0_20_43_7]